MRQSPLRYTAADDKKVISSTGSQGWSGAPPDALAGAAWYVANAHDTSLCFVACSHSLQDVSVPCRADEPAQAAAVRVIAACSGPGAAPSQVCSARLTEAIC